MRLPHFLRNVILTALLALAALLLWSALQHPESTLEIRATRAGVSSPDGFYVWHHLDANGIPFKSITPQGNGLIIRFDSSAQSDAAREVLNRTLPQGYIIAQQEEDNAALSLLSRLRHDRHRLG
ncbi:MULTISPECIES: EnvZ/OmpR regulon moderator MzrA [Tenebrionibacter/Tenebrionicola group]|jgi:hypothetical protein|uniref:Modulator protein MzrA n=2 Tax=Tenebrionibacter/Tenebrionicola group TaxID=2969848 RepID=A0A8K0XZI0_9ENTR|nr:MULTISPECIES: EnvZ/OmpR regulon moderator MzrA [Tenebrionibacter/Tenebrionicola group]MBK4715624.1 EnvZ/OmpR regulon moderator MzrA [Tenebrionibacter intestinalis]MBV4412930.1 EnvZ/OmpR regulon moderator MzrA [Tenebrionicola larvae]MBV5094592.1 EnvZ/OmpR regulon moderator MzrA [Tenebrionicola larvae]